MLMKLTPDRLHFRLDFLQTMIFLRPPAPNPWFQAVKQ